MFRDDIKRYDTEHFANQVLSISHRYPQDKMDYSDYLIELHHMLDSEGNDQLVPVKYMDLDNRVWKDLTEQNLEQYHYQEGQPIIPVYRYEKGTMPDVDKIGYKRGDYWYSNPTISINPNYSKYAIYPYLKDVSLHMINIELSHMPVRDPGQLYGLGDMLFLLMVDNLYSRSLMDEYAAMKASDWNTLRIILHSCELDVEKRYYPITSEYYHVHAVLTDIVEQDGQVVIQFKEGKSTPVMTY